MCAAIAFTSHKKQSALSKPTLYQLHHVFDMINNTSTYSSSFSTFITPTVVVPHYRENLPLGTSVFLDQYEYSRVLKEKYRVLNNYEDNLKKLKEKLGETYEIKTPIPGGKHDFCSVCREKFINFKEHVRS